MEYNNIMPMICKELVYYFSMNYIFKLISEITTSLQILYNLIYCLKYFHSIFILVHTAKINVNKIINSSEK